KDMEVEIENVPDKDIPANANKVDGTPPTNKLMVPK
ncbi:hypothetical protein LCGC14_2345150, partial [marine sediment metagenome]